MAQITRKFLFDRLWAQLTDDSYLAQILVGPRQVGKTTLALQVRARWRGPTHYAVADQPAPPDADWIISQWKKARGLDTRGKQTLLILDEIQKIPRWSEVVKMMVDEDHFKPRKGRTIILGSSSLLVQKGMKESMAGRFELHRVPHWSFRECRKAFRLSFKDYLRFGGYPGLLKLRASPPRWVLAARDNVIEAVISKDVLLMNPVQKPALLRQLFGAVCAHPAEVVSYQKILGQLQDAGNTVTIAHYLDLLSAAFLTAPLHKWSGEWLRQRASSPKIILRDNALVTAMTGRMDDDPAWRGRLAENAVGAALVALAESRGGEVFYWRERDLEVDFVVKIGPKIWAVEVKSGPWKPPLQGLHIFLSRNNGVRGIVIGPPSPGALFGSLSLEDFLTSPDRLLDI